MLLSSVKCTLKVATQCRERVLYCASILPWI